MYKCKCKRNLDLTKTQWSNIAKNYQQIQKESVQCECGEILNVYVSPDPCEDAWYVSQLSFESDLKTVLYSKR